jgi:hypothetical protein
LAIVLPEIGAKEAHPASATLRESCSDLNRFSIAAALIVLMHPVKAVLSARKLTNVSAERENEFSPPARLSVEPMVLLPTEFVRKEWTALP